MKIYIAILAAMFPLIAMGHAATVTLDGKVLNVETVEITTRATPAPQPIPEPVPEPPANECKTSVMARAIDWKTPGGRRTLNIGGGGLVYSFVATDSPDYGGYINLMEVAGQESVVRRISLSSCPGKPLAAAQCSREGTGLISIPWLQRDYVGACSLIPGEKYYLEIDNVSGCFGNCKAYLTIPTNGRR